MNYPKELTETYEIYEQIGAGGGGMVYRALHRRLRKIVVLKKVAAIGLSIEQCRTETDILKDLRHSYLPQVLDFIESSEGIFTVMDFIPGKSLGQMLKEQHEFSEKEVLRYARQLSEALAYLHSQKKPIIHGDIKPDNIMITPEGNVCLIDFNISGILNGQGAETMGYTPGFSAPEQAVAYVKLRKAMQQSAASAERLPRQSLSGKTMPLTAETESLSGETALLTAGTEGLSGETAVLSSETETLTAATALLSEETELLSGKTALLQPDGQETQTLLQQARTNRDENKKEYRKAGSAGSKAGGVSGITIDKRSDIYSLGATLYTLLSGKLLKNPVKDMAGLQISSGFFIVLSKMVEVDPDKRYQDAGQLLKSIDQVHKKDKRYRGLLHRQELAFMFLIVCLAVSVFMVAEGFKVKERERREKYELLVEDMQGGILAAWIPEDFEKVYVEAVSLYPESLEAYYEKALYLFAKKNYEVTAGYMEEVLLLSLDGSEELWGNFYHLYGECFFQMEDYKKAGIYYQTAIKYRDDNPAIYRDYAIALVYLNDISEAEEVLQTAIGKGLQEDSVYMVQGEIERMTGNPEQAVSCFAEVLKSDDEALRLRAYVLASKAFLEIGTEEALLTDVEWLNRAAQELPMNSRLQIYENLAQNYIKLGELKQDHAYFLSALSVFEQMKEMNWDTYQTYSNAVVLSMRISDLTEAEKWAQEMSEQYPDRYGTYMRLAFLEVEIQSSKENEKRDYKKFQEYYQTAESYYEEQMSGNATDTEMLLLKDIYGQVLDGGWLD